MRGCFNILFAKGTRAFTHAISDSTLRYATPLDLFQPCALYQTNLLSLGASATSSSSRARVLSTSASVATDDAAVVSSNRASGKDLPALSRISTPPLHLDGSRSADPGEPRYTAPYWVPEGVREAHQLPSVLFTDPWVPHEEHEIRRRHAEACMQLLRRSATPLTMQQVFESINRDLPPDLPPLATPAYVKHLLEHLRNNRMLYGIKNPESPLSPGHPNHPRLYAVLPYQAARKGSPRELARQDEAQREKDVQQALKRLRRGKPPYAIHRRRARFSIWQHLQSQEALQQLRASLPAEGPSAG